MKRKSTMRTWSRWKKERQTKQEGFQRKADQVMAFPEEEELTEGMKEKLIEKVIVYSEDKIEIVWTFEEHLDN